MLVKWVLCSWFFITIHGIIKNLAYTLIILGVIFVDGNQMALLWCGSHFDVISTLSSLCDDVSARTHCLHYWPFCVGNHSHHSSTHYCDFIMNTIASQITSLTIVYLTVNSGTDQRKHQRSASLAFVRGIHRRPVNSPHKRPVTRKMFPFDDVIMLWVSFESSMSSLH